MDPKHLEELIRIERRYWWHVAKRDLVRELLVVCQNSIDEYGEGVHPSVVPQDPGATEGGPPWPGNGHTR